jgi:RNA polymerase sigma factor (sigma-70 family)
MDNNTKIEQHLKDPYVDGIIRSVSGRYSKAIDEHDLYSIAMFILMRCVERYDPTKGAKFTSYFYQQLSYAYKNELKKKRFEFSTDSSVLANAIEERRRSNLDEESRKDVRIVLESMPEDMRKIMQQKFYHEMSFKQIAEENGYSRETARRRFQKAVKMFKKIKKS